MTKKIFLTALTSVFLFLTSCTTYYISLDSFKQQFTGIDSTKLKSVVVQGPMYERYNYNANPIKTIKCADDLNNPVELKNSPSIEIRITHGYKNKRTVFYFDRIYVNKNSVFGVKSRFMDFITQSISLDSITKIEVQDGHKKFSYVDK